MSFLNFLWCCLNIFLPRAFSELCRVTFKQKSSILSQPVPQMEHKLLSSPQLQTLFVRTTSPWRGEGEVEGRAEKSHSGTAWHNGDILKGFLPLLPIT